MAPGFRCSSLIARGSRATARTLPCSPATAASTSTCCRPGRRRRSPSSSAAAPTRWPSCAAAASTARAGTAPACWPTSRTCSTTSSRRPTGSSQRGSRRPIGWRSPGGSNGGLLVGAALTQRPELFRAVICGVPLLDMLRYHLFRIAALWIPEYGSPEDPAAVPLAARLLAVSPRPGRREVPGGAVLHAAASDTRVDPMHARKMAARLQAATASGAPHSAPDREQGWPRRRQAAPQGDRPAGRRVELLVLRSSEFPTR